MKKVVNRDTLNYRKITDVPINKEAENKEETEEQKEDEMETKAEEKEAAPEDPYLLG